MQENWLELKAAFDSSKRFVLATIVSTSGSTYQKIGSMMLINEQGSCSGLLSGGCLEADISFHAEGVFNSNQPKLLNYDLTKNADLLWGLGLGCDGALDILLQPLTPQNHHQSFAALLESTFSGKSGFYCIDSIFDTFVESETLAESEKLEGRQQQSPTNLMSENVFIPQSISDAPTKLSVESLAIPIAPPINVLICGAGPDAQPLLNICKQLGWQISLWDHRQVFLDQAAFIDADLRRKTRAEKITSPSEFDGYDAAVVMTHNLENDACYLSKMLPSTLQYIGLLGPSGRKNKLFNLVKDLPGYSNDTTITDRIFGPVGLDLGGRGPQAIALSITAQIQQIIIKQRNINAFKCQKVKPSLQVANPNTSKVPVGRKIVNSVEVP